MPGARKRRRAMCPGCRAWKPVLASGKFQRHSRRDDGTAIPEQSRKAGIAAEPCPGSGRDSGLW